MTSKGKIILNQHSFRLEESYYGQVLCVLGEARCEISVLGRDGGCYFRRKLSGSHQGKTDTLKVLAAHR